MRRICLLLAALLTLMLTACGQDMPPADDTIDTPKVYTVEELVGMSAAEIIEIYGEDYEEVVPEGDPPYFHYGDGVPYRFIGTAEDAVISAVSSRAAGTEMVATISVGDSLASLDAAAAAQEGYEFFPAENWYDEGNGQYGWAHIRGEKCQYSCFIKDNVLVSFECWLIEE